MSRFDSHPTFKILPRLVFLTTLLVSFVSNGPEEGAQRNFASLKFRSDWWGPIPPLIYGEWPGSSQVWNLTLSFLQITFFYIGFRLLTHEKNSPKSLLFFLLNLTLLMIGLQFCSQLWRDATLLSLVTLGLGLTKLSSKSKPMKLTFFLIGASFIIFGALCKILFAPLIALFYLYNLRFYNLIPDLGRFFRIALFLTLSATPIFLNVILVDTMNLKKTFPEQQPMIFDLTSLYCWGTSLESNQDAIRILKIAKKTGYPDEAICSSLEPMGWDTLRTDRPLWKYSSPIVPINEEIDSRNLTNGWIRTLINHPTEYLQIKIIQSTQVLTMANFLGPRTDRVFLEFQIPIVLHKFADAYILVLRVMDRLRLFSLGTFILILISVIWRETLKKSFQSWDTQSRGFSLILILLVAMFQLIVTTLGFVSGNGRYSFPFVLLGLIFLIREFSWSKQSI